MPTVQRPPHPAPSTLQARREAARRAAFAAGLAGFSHDLRGILSPALLAAERMQSHPDPAVRRAAEVTLRSVDRALDLMRGQLGALRAELPTIVLAPVALAPAVAAAGPAGLRLDCAVPETLAVLGHADLLHHGLRSLFADLRACGAGTLTLQADHDAPHVVLTGTHDGPPQPDPPAEIADQTERAAARDFLRACGGDLLPAAGQRVVVRLLRA